METLKEELKVVFSAAEVVEIAQVERARRRVEEARLAEEARLVEEEARRVEVARLAEVAREVARVAEEARLRGRTVSCVGVSGSCF